MKIKVTTLLTMMCICLASCLPNKETGDVSPTLFFKQISASPDANNALREKITVSMTKSAAVHVEYWKKGETDVTKILKTEIQQGEMNPTFTLMFMEPKTEYEFVVRATQGDQRTLSDAYKFTTRDLGANFENYQLFEKDYKFNGYIFITQRMAPPGYLILLNDQAKVVWYEPMAPNLTATNYDSLTKSFTCFIGGDANGLFVAEEVGTIDIHGNTLFRKKKEALQNKMFHHDVRLMPDGNYIAINFTPKQFDLTKWGGTANETVNGDGYTIFDKNGTILKEWDCFGTMNPQDDPTIMDEFPALDATVKEDWMHANAIEICPDGNYIMSMNMKSQIWKINSKTGQTMWRLGIGGDVTAPKEMIQNMQHSCHISKDGDLMFFDNTGGNGNSRVIKAKVDDVTKSAIPSLIINLPKEHSSIYQSSAYMIDDDHVLVGATAPQNLIVYDKSGKIVWRVGSSHQFFRAQYIESLKFQ